jgi:hypothetical protein
MARVMISALVLLVLAHANGLAQTCFRGHPAPRCRVVILNEVGYAYRVNADTLSTGGRPQVHYLGVDLGMLRNLSPRWAVGPVVGANALVDYAFEVRPTLQGRVRYWATPTLGVDFSTGLMLGQAAADAAIGAPRNHRLGVTSELGVSFADRLKILTQLEYLQDAQDRDISVYLGGRLGSAPALWATLATGVLLGLGCALEC